MHLATYTKADAGRMLAHYERSIGERDHIDKNGLVYNLAPEFDGGCHKRFAELCEGLEIGAKTRPLADFVVTMPEGFSGDAGKFFKAAYGELADRVGAERMVSAYVHMDEPGAQPHMHFCFVPIVESPVMTNDKTSPLLWTEKDEKKNPAHKAGEQKRDSKGTLRWKRVPMLDENGKPVVRRTATASKMFSKSEMKELHPRMEKSLCEKLGVSRVGIILGEDDARKALSGLHHERYERVTAEIKRAEQRSMELNNEIADKEGDLVELDSAIEDKRFELQDLGEQVERETRRLESVRQRITEKELEPAPQTVSESLRALWTARNDGARVGELAGEVEGLRSRISELEGENQRARERVAELDRGLPGLRGRYQQLQQRFGALEQRVEQVIQRLREVPETVSAWALDLAARMGKRTYNPNSLDYQMRAAREAARAVNVGHPDAQRGYRRSR